MASIASTQVAKAREPYDQQTPWYVIGGLVLVVVWAYWNIIQDVLMDAWRNPQYSHGFLVPVFTAALLAMRREPFVPVPLSQRLLGVAIIVGALAIRLFAAYVNTVALGVVTILPVLIGVFILVGGLPALRWSWGPIAFLVFMLPLPVKGEQMFLLPLQKVATVTSTFALQTAGMEAYNEGTKIFIGDTSPLNVEEQCSGLRMATIFLAMAVAMSMVIDRPWWTKAAIIVSAIPIAILTNIIRIAITALLYKLLGPESEVAKHFFHDVAGWFMMPLALGFMYLEMLLLDNLFIEEPIAAPQTTGFGAKPAVRRPAATTRAQ